MDRSELPRRAYLETFLTTAAVTGLAGCNSSQDTTDTSSVTDTPTATPDRAPQILAHGATPQAAGTSLSVYLEGEDNTGLSLARIQYGENTIEKTPENATVTINDEFTDLGGYAHDGTTGRVTYLLEDTAGQQTRVEAYPDEAAPELLTYSVETTGNAREISLRMEGRDDIGLEEIRLLVGEQLQIQQNISGESEFSTSQRVNLPESATLQKNTVTASIEDWNGNTTEAATETYVRKYDVMEDTRLDIGAVYVPWSKGGYYCLEDINAEAAIGEYGQPIISAETTNKHIDQMMGHGINRVMFNYKGHEGARRELSEFLNSDLIDEIDEVEAFYPVKNRRWVEDLDWREDVLALDMTDLKNRILSRENCARYDGRPILHIWAVHQFSQWGPDKYERKIMAEWGSYENFIDDMRSLLTVDGTEPFIIGNILGAGIYGSEETETGMPPMTTLLDGISTWTASGVLESDSIVDWEEAMSFVEANYQGAAEYAERNDMEFIPMVFPGFDDRANDCWGRDRYIPRNLEKFEEMLALAEEYSTTEMIDVATWNDWPEGHQIEPGMWRGEDYDRAYLEVIREFQR